MKYTRKEVSSTDIRKSGDEALLDCQRTVNGNAEILRTVLDRLDALEGSKQSFLPVQKTGKWNLISLGSKKIDIACSECGYIRVPEYAYGYTLEEIDGDEFRKYIADNRLNYCECCGVRMEVSE